MSGWGGVGGRVWGIKVDVNEEFKFLGKFTNQRTNGPVNAHLVSWPRKEQNIQNLENIW